MADKMIQCKACGKEIAANAKVCPHCGAKNKKPIYKKWWFWLIVVLVVLGIGSGTSNSTKTEEETKTETGTSVAVTSKQEAVSASSEEKTVEWVTCSIEEMTDLLEKNALKAKNQYEGMYVEITGELSTIDASGDYISITADEWGLNSILCRIKNEQQEEIVMGLEKGETITIRGKITGVGEILGYSLDIMEIIP